MFFSQNAPLLFEADVDTVSTHAFINEFIRDKR